MVVNSDSFNRHITATDLLLFMVFSKGVSQTLGIWWNRTEDDLDEYIEYSINQGFKVEFERKSGPSGKPLTEDFEFDVESGNLSELNKLYDWLVSQPERFWGVQFILDDHEIDDEFYKDFLS